jgi:hypothetical protein
MLREMIRLRSEGLRSDGTSSQAELMLEDCKSEATDDWYERETLRRAISGRIADAVEFYL